MEKTWIIYFVSWIIAAGISMTWILTNKYPEQVYGFIAYIPFVIMTCYIMYDNRFLLKKFKL